VIADDDLYARLGVDRRAAPGEIRSAYRRLARQHHPDRPGVESAEAMTAVNDAYAVLGDPERRRRYDRELDEVARGRVEEGTHRAGSGAAAAPSPAGSWHSSSTEPVRFPWRLVAGIAAVGIAVVIAGVVLERPVPEAVPDNVLRSGDCVVLSLELDAREVSCSAAHDATVVALVPLDQVCPTGTESYRDHQGMGTACVVRVAPGSATP
jgi:hypothetical protein